MSKVLNYLWLSLDFPSAEQEQQRTSFTMPAAYVKNLLETAARNPDTDVQLWVDDKRLTPHQKYDMKKKISAPNVDICNLREIPEYANESFYNIPEMSDMWRNGHSSLIWGQIDAVKLLVCL